MSVTFTYGETVVLHSRTPRIVDDERVKDDYGALVYDETDTTLTGIAIWPESATEVYHNQDRTNSVYLALLPDNIDVDAVDSLTWRALRFQVQGEAQQLQSPLTALAMQLVRINRVEG